MSRINGTGTWFLGVEKSDQNGVFTATAWVTVFFFPFVPLKRYLIKPTKVGGNRFQFQTLGKTDLNWHEILLTYFYGWILMPLGFLAPIPFAIVEVQNTLGVPKMLQPIVIGLAIVWMGVYVWKLKTWDENRWLK